MRRSAQLDVIEDAYVLCAGGRIERVGRMRDLGRLDGEVEELDGRGLAAVPGLVDCHTHACFAGDRGEEFSLRAGGASYEELHAAGGGILSTVRATRGAGEDGLREAVRRHRGWMLRCGDDDVRGEVGLRARPRHGACVPARDCDAEGGVPTYLGLHAVPPEFDDAEAYLDFVVAEVLPEAAQLAEAADVFLERGAFDVGAGAPVPRSARRSRARAPPPRGPVHGGRRRRARDRARRALGRPPGGHGRAGRRARSRRARSRLFCCRRARCSSIGRCRPARALVDAGAAVALATDFNPGSAFCESLPLVCSLACTQLGLSPAEALAACTVNAAHVLGRADRKGRLAPGYDADVVLLDAPDWRYLAYHLGGDLVAAVIQGGQVAWRR